MFRFRRFSVRNCDSALRVGTDAVLLGASVSLPKICRNALDIGTGTGIIALMIAQRSPSTFVTGIDIDGPSVEEASFNFKASPWAERLVSLKEDLRSYEPEDKFDLIFSNPPFYDASLKNPDERLATARHTESLGPRDIFAFASRWLSPEGQVSIIIPSDSLKAWLRLASSFGLLPRRIIHVKTTERKVPKREIIEFGRLRQTLHEETLVLMSEGEKSPEYRALLTEFTPPEYM